MATGPLIPEIQHFQNLTLKILGQCHTWRPHSRYNTLSTHITFVRCRWALTFLSIAIEKFDLENPRSMSWLRWTFKVTPRVQHSIDSHPFRSKSIRHPIPEIQHFQTLTLKIQGQGHGWGERLSHNMGPTLYRLTSLSFHVNLPSHSWDTTFFLIWPWKSKVMVMVEVKVENYKVGVTFYRLTSLSFHVNRPSHSYSIFKIWPWKSKANVMGEVNVENHNMCPTLYRLTSLSLHVNLSSHSWDTTFSKFDLENRRSRILLRSKLKVTKWV